jgi:hypothetical protein
MVNFIVTQFQDTAMIGKGPGIGILMGSLFARSIWHGMRFTLSLLFLRFLCCTAHTPMNFSPHFYACTLGLNLYSHCDPWRCAFYSMAILVSNPLYPIQPTRLVTLVR